MLSAPVLARVKQRDNRVGFRITSLSTGTFVSVTTLTRTGEVIFIRSAASAFRQDVFRRNRRG